MRFGLEQMKRSNNFGALRLFFAVLVVLSHSSELLDGDQSREILKRITGNLSFGQVGVDGFFLISGYLITKSFEESRSAKEYVLKRVLRIYPGFVVSYLFCILIVGPWAGGQLDILSSPKIWLAMVLLQKPNMPGVFAGTPFPTLNPPMWTIAYEFRCYLLVLLLGLTGLLSKRFVVALLVASALVLSAINPNILAALFPIGLTPFLGSPDTSLWFAAIFGCGALFYLYRDNIHYDWRLAALAACGLIGLIFSPRLAEFAVVVFGGYILFWFAFNVTSPALAAVGQKIDLSYGIYLYAWPVQKSLIWLVPDISPWMVFVTTLAIAGALALVSWKLVEKPFLNLKAAFVPARLSKARNVQ